MVDNIVNNAVIVGTVEMILSGQYAKLAINDGNVDGVLRVMELVLQRHPGWGDAPMNVTIFNDGSVTVSAKLGLRTLVFTLVSPSRVSGMRYYSVIYNQMRLMQDLRLIDAVKVLKDVVMHSNDAKAVIADLLNNSLNAPY
ncbi:hypothetical protein [Caldivirga maquilingensis]|uniref:Uncharacterized protein n=1 Tax=Caldivirga maquilingensis (strain ATCC 700844 / DSM 13496 / JCM 10307 / IC-167) TaxID=397948 RepID=A8MC19_CALMQ|nr:hypothetical protein [Caldivirga maquilingensis]ABW02803.1 hypothetical protein Cmaq_1987 [Caldivirga maquilingensis IC-167]